MYNPASAAMHEHGFGNALFVLHAAVATTEKLCDKNDPNHFSLCTIYVSELTPFNTVQQNKARPSSKPGISDRISQQHDHGGRR